MDLDTYYMHCKAEKPIKKEAKVRSFGVDPNKKLEKEIEKGILKHKAVTKDDSKKIQKQRLIRGLTQKELAQKANVTVQKIIEIENGKAIHNPQLINKVQRILKL
uniref:HTH cro/C1-type domain-containing protein n=1 Tax=viral metagenome TaxID=1070528 RepID=A0A6C0L021_9ZZZZ|tara:strand:- start:6161 stop:6475 length:315 start_codon:yes stop_codon:yes gene_type:complete